MRTEPIMLREKRFNYLPHRFLYRGMEHQVFRVQRIWDVAATRSDNARRFFEVRCAGDQMFRLIHDVVLNAWYAQRRGG